ncbi:membrane-spanning 4-domains subfamily A member 15-like isoform X1 [Anabas testudineus]|uniref:membrane-spanning 4-domains subfamily A member 15-like isoform X1 n=1 Tax=Anabas testudineus TaxID=64144 RepID=UPI000E455276|nr:membrane-spanning 4-domains subfamily A member 15-like isoform X1 [Anabas testudineus]
MSATSSVGVVTQVQQDLGTPPPGTRPRNGNFKMIGGMQILVALSTFVFGFVIISSKRQEKLAVNSGIFVWGPMTCFMAGSLTVAAGTSLSHTPIKCAVILNAFAAVVSIAATIIYCLDVTFSNPFSDFWNQDPGVVTVFTGFSFVMFFLEFGLSMIVALSCCRVTSHVTQVSPPVHVDRQQFKGGVHQLRPIPGSCLTSEGREHTFIYRAEVHRDGKKKNSEQRFVEQQKQSEAP